MSSRQLRESFTPNIGFWAQEVAEPRLLLSLGASFLIGVDAFSAMQRRTAARGVASGDRA